MASSPPVEGNGGSTPGGAVPPTPGEAPDPSPTTKWPRWRILMLVGALILLGAALLETGDAIPGWAVKALFFGGYILLAYGFFTAMSARKRQ